MSNSKNAEYSSTNLISQMLKAKPKMKKNIEQLDNESLNTMDYYKEDSSNKNSLIEESKLNNKLLFNPQKLESKNSTITEGNEIHLGIKKVYKNKHKSSNTIIEQAGLNTPKVQNDKKRSNDMAKICCKFYSEFDLNNKTCIRCKRDFCKKCFEGNIKNNLYNNSNHENDLNKDIICYYCKKKPNYSKNYMKEKQKNKSPFLQEQLEPSDTFSEPNMKMTFLMEKTKSIMDLNDKSIGKKKYLADQYKEYKNILNQLEYRKKEIEIKKDISLNICERIKKIIELEYEKNTNKLNELIIRLKKIKDNINEKMNQNFNNETELQIIIDINKKNLSNIYKIYENYSKKVISRPLFRGYKLYESDNILINYSDTYYMKNKEIFSDLPFGKVYIKVDRFTNNYINYLNFSTLIKQNDRAYTDKTNNISFQNINNNFNKARFLINMIVNNKLIRLNKTNKDNNDMSLSYDFTEEEDKILFHKNKDSIVKNNFKTNNAHFNVKVFVSEIML